MSKNLNIALQNAIGDLGTDVLKSPFLVSIMQDYGAFNVHDKHNETTISIHSISKRTTKLCKCQI